jgi:hypothetical protein
MKTVKVMADYESFPLWATDDEVDNIDPASLPISAGLAEALLQWADAYDATLRPDDPAASGFADPTAERAFYADGLSLAQRLAGELGGAYQVEYFDGAATTPV